MEAVRSLLNTIHWMNSTAFSGKLTSRLTNLLYRLGTLKDLMKERHAFLKLSLIFVLLFIGLYSSAQKVRHSTYEDSLPAAQVDSLIKAQHSPCLLYTSDAADERSSVDLG